MYVTPLFALVMPFLVINCSCTNFVWSFVDYVNQLIYNISMGTFLQCEIATLFSVIISLFAKLLALFLPLCHFLSRDFVSDVFSSQLPFLRHVKLSLYVIFFLWLLWILQVTSMCHHFNLGHSFKSLFVCHSKKAKILFVI